MKWSAPEYTITSLTEEELTLTKIENSKEAQVVYTYKKVDVATTNPSGELDSIVKQLVGMWGGNKIVGGETHTYELVENANGSIYLNSSEEEFEGLYVKSDKLVTICGTMYEKYASLPTFVDINTVDFADFFGYGSDGSGSVRLTKIGDPIGKWQLQSITQGDITVDEELDNEEWNCYFKVVWEFKENGILSLYSGYDGATQDGTWKRVGAVLTINGAAFTVASLTAEELVFRVADDYEGTWVDFTYRRMPR